MAEQKQIINLEYLDILEKKDEETQIFIHDIRNNLINIILASINIFIFYIFTKFYITNKNSSFFKTNIITIIIINK